MQDIGYAQPIRSQLKYKNLEEIHPKNNNLAEDSQKSFAEAYEKHSDAIFRHIFFRVYNRELALELTQETFMRAWESIANGTKVKNIKAFLYKTAERLVIDNARRVKDRSLEETAEQGFEGMSLAANGLEDPLKTAENRADMESTLKLLQALDAEYREAIMLRYIDGLSVKEIAEMAGDTPGAVSTRIYRGIQELKKLYGN